MQQTPMDDDRTPADERPGTSLAFGTVALGIVGVTALVIALLVGAGKSDGTSSVTATGERQTVEVMLAEFSVTPATIEVAGGTDLTLRVMNHGTMAHDLAVEGGSTKVPMLAPGASADLHVGVVSKSMQAWCTVPGHKEAGMVLAIHVTGAASEVAAGGSTDTSAATGGGGATIDPNAKPAPEWKPFDPHLAPAPGGTEHQVTLHAKETQAEVAPGVMQERWTFNGQTPGPVLRGRVGDLFTVTLVNDGKVGHSIDFHASQTNMDQDMRTLNPGESLVYQFTAQYSGIWMYHCGTAPILHHIGNGMFGAVVIDPPDLAPVDHEYVMVQSEMYLGANGQPGDLTKMLANKPDAVVFNGYYNQYKFAPISDVKAGERVRIWVLDAGPSDISSFHIVGTIFDTVYKEGDYMLRPGPAHGGSQTLDL
ncbi:MAG TPA: multicopper oxidase domain-containing protein, partial [Acidimicrobiales bacterium]|nr:multicopper oxidase domain-containing protein [Acidimicrobiales bacterium]